MDLRIFTEPQQGATYDDQLSAAQASEAAGFGAFFRSDHFLTMGGDGLPGPTDAWLTLAALARETSDIRLGTLVTSATFRPPGLLAIQVAQVDQMSGGRVELGLGSGWYEQEHLALGLSFPSLSERFQRLEEQLTVITGLWGTPEGQTFSHAGEHVTMTNSPALPQPVQSHIPIIVGGAGAKKTPALAARFADEYNVPFASVGDTRAAIDRVRAVAKRPLTYSAAQVVCCGRDEAEFSRRASAIGREPAELRAHGVAGTPSEVMARLTELSAAGVTRVYLQVLDLHDLDHIALLGREVISPAAAVTAS